MPYNFEATFTQPILAKLDNGLIKGPKDWANAITKAYITTIKAGLPQGVAPTLPAPGLLGAPYAIGAAGFNTADSKEKVMFTLINAYFTAKELSLNKASIDGLIQTIKQLIAKIKAKQAQIKNIVEQVNLIKEELKQLPPLLIEIKDAIKDVIQEQTFNVKNIENVFTDAKLELGPEQFKITFAKELRLIDVIKNFNATDVAGVKEIVLILSEYGERTVDSLADVKNKPLKDYIQSKLVGIAKEFVTLANGILDPQMFVDYLSQLAPVRPKIKTVYDKVQQFLNLKILLNPALKKLEIKKQIILKDIQVNLQNKLIKIREKMQNRIIEHNSKRKEGKAELIYKKAKKKIDAFRKTNEQKIKKLQKDIKLYKQAYSSIKIIIGKSTSLSTKIPEQFEQIKNQILTQVKDVQNTVVDFQQLFNEQEETNKATEYMNFIGLSQFANLAALLIIQTKCSFQVFKNLFELPNPNLTQYVVDIVLIKNEVNKLIKTIESIKKAKAAAKTTPQDKADTNIQTTSPSILSKKPSSLKDLIKKIKEYLNPKIQKLQAWLLKKIKQTTNYIKTKAEKFRVDFEIFALTLLPLKSGVEDVKNKKLVAEAKKKKLEEKKLQVEKFAKKTSFIYNMTIGSKDLLLNIDKGVYKLSENETNIDKIINNYFNYQKMDKEPAVQASLDGDKKKLKQEFDSLKLIEVLIYGLLETTKEMKESNFANDLKNILASLKENTPGIQTLQLIQNIINNPPKTPIDVRDLANSLGGSVLQDISATNTLLNLERKYLQKSRQIIKTMCNVKQLKNEKVLSKLNYIKNQLDKNQSFLLIAFDYLKKQLTIFAQFIIKKVTAVAKKILDKLKSKKEKKQKQIEKDLKKIIENKINPDAIVMSVMFGLAARAFWTGATWVGPTASTHIVLNIGLFKMIKAKTEDGASGMIKEIANSFEKQLQGMFGIITPPPNTAIIPIPFNGYK